MNLLLMENDEELKKSKNNGSDSSKDSVHLKENFLLMAFISKGNNGQVFKVQEKLTSSFYAMKLLEKSGNKILIQREKGIMENLKSHPFLVEFHSAYHTKYYIAIVMEYIDGIRMTQYLAEFDNGCIDEKSAAFYLAEVSMAVHFLHKNGIIHRDIKLDNIMINGDGHIKLIDFGISKDKMEFRNRTCSCVGLVDNGAPEYFRRLPYSFSLDWYTVGTALYIMLTGDHPFETFIDFSTEEEKADMISAMEKKNFVFNRDLSDEAVSILHRLLEPDPEKRLGTKDSDEFMEISEHVFLKHIDWIKVKNKEIKPPYVPNEDVNRYLSVQENSTFSSH